MNTMNQSKKSMSDLINKFNFNKEFYLSKNCNEATTRLEFIDEFLKILGWDVSNKRCLSEDNKDVQVEKRIDNNNIADYILYENNYPKFFIEAKSTSYNLNDKIIWGKLLNDARLIDCPFAILTNFKSFYFFDVLSEDENNLLFKLDYYNYVSDFEKLFILYKIPIQHSVINENFDLPTKTINSKLFIFLSSYCVSQAFITTVGFDEFDINIPIEFNCLIFKTYLRNIKKSFYYSKRQGFMFNTKNDNISSDNFGVNIGLDDAEFLKDIFVLENINYTKRVITYITKNKNDLLAVFHKKIKTYQKSFISKDKNFYFCSILMGWYILYNMGILKKENDFFDKGIDSYYNVLPKKVRKLLKYSKNKNKLIISARDICIYKIGGIKCSEKAHELIRFVESLDLGFVKNKKLHLNQTV